MSQIDIILLCLLCEKDCYGYEVESIIEERHMREWTEIGFSSIYNSLSKLEKKGIIGSRYEKEYGSPNRKVYSIKENTTTTVLEEITRMIRSPKRASSEFDIGIAFSDLLPQEDVIEALKNYKVGLEKRKQNILSRFSEQPVVQNTPHLKALFTRPLKTLTAEIEWVEEFLKNYL